MIVLLDIYKLVVKVVQSVKATIIAKNVKMSNGDICQLTGKHLDVYHIAKGILIHNMMNVQNIILLKMVILKMVKM